MPDNTSTSDLIKGVATHESSVVEGLLLARLENMEASGLDSRTYSLVMRRHTTCPVDKSLNRPFPFLAPDLEPSVRHARCPLLPNER